MQRLIIIFILTLPFICKAQINLGGMPYSWKNEINSKIPTYTTERLNLKKIEGEDEKDEMKGVPPRFGFKHWVKLDLNNSGVWTELKNGDRVWQLEVNCPGAKSINFTFDKFWLPEGGKLYIYSKDKKNLIGAFSNLNNKGTRDKLRGFGCGLVYNQNVILEYYQPANKPQAILNINSIVHGYRYIPKFWQNDDSRGFGDAGPCQVNVNCSPEGDNWQDEKKGIALAIVDGTRWCSGSLINNTCNDGELYFLTADHCLGWYANIPRKDAVDNPIADDWSFMWNYESPNCINPVNEPSQIVTNGAIVVANSNPNVSNIVFTDFALLKLTESPAQLVPPVEVTFNGWSRTTNPPKGGACIHHARADIKKISTHNIFPLDFVTNGDVGIYDPMNFWEINWIATPNGHSITENTSSGSPLFTNEGLIIGQLYGGDLINCNDPENDEGDFGKFNLSWDANSAIERQLKHWLDPCGTNAMELDGGILDVCQDIVFVNSPISNSLYYQADDEIIASSSLSSTSTVEMKAGNTVLLTPDFNCDGGSDFWAHIAPCSPVVLPIFKKSSTGNKIADNIQTTFDEIRVYPNPANDIINIEFYIVNDDFVKISISDLSGKQYAVYQNNHTGNNSYKSSVDISSLSSGIYLVSLQTNNYIETQKFVISK